MSEHNNDYEGLTDEEWLMIMEILDRAENKSPKKKHQIKTANPVLRSAVTVLLPLNILRICKSTSEAK